METKDNFLLTKSKEFAINIINLCESINSCYAITNQLIRSGTSIGANIREAQYAHSNADFITKLEIALKECNESEYWLELLFETNKIDEKTFNKFKNMAGSIRRVLIKSCVTTKQK